MRLVAYMFISMILMGIVTAFTYTITSAEYTIELIGLSFTFPIAIWVVIPMVILFLFSFMHMFFHGFKNYFALKQWQKDSHNLEDALYWSLLNEPKEQRYGIDAMESVASLLSKSSLKVLDEVEGLNPRLARTVSMLQKIQRGEYVDFKEERISSKLFKPGNPILIQNRLNRLENDDKFIDEVMKSTTEFSEIVRNEALEIFARKADFRHAHKYAKRFDAQNFLVMLERVSAEEKLGLTPQILADFVEVLSLGCKDFLKIAFVTKKAFNPQENLTLFRSFQTANPNAQQAYLYLLFEYELMEQVDLYLSEHDESDFVKFRALYTLKREHSQFKLEDLMDIDTLCNEVRL
ncbi:MAG: hypothetical protein RL113_548 [Pseudomonadota bacterium]